jgi:methionine-rich copper-binding protein CopC
MRISDRLHHGADAARQGGGLRGPHGPRARRLALTVVAIAATVALGLLTPARAPAHSLLLESSPAANATLTEAPAQISLRFNNRIEKTLSTIRVLDERGAARPVTMRPADGAADRLIAAVPALAPGAWRVEWQVLSTDGHIVSGSFSFRVAPQVAR